MWVPTTADKLEIGDNVKTAPDSTLVIDGTVDTIEVASRYHDDGRIIEVAGTPHYVQNNYFFLIEVDDDTE